VFLSVAGKVAPLFLRLGIARIATKRKRRGVRKGTRDFIGYIARAIILGYTPHLGKLAKVLIRCNSLG
jgi:hypothetical protein